MTTTEFVLSIIASISWPLCILGIAIVIKHELSKDKKRKDN